MQICDNCQTRLPDDVLYCLDCGTRLETPTVIRPPMPKAMQPRRLNLFKWIAGLGVIAVCVFGLSSAVITYRDISSARKPEPAPVVERIVYVTPTPQPTPERQRVKTVPEIDNANLRKAANAANVARRAECRLVNGRNNTVNLRHYCDERNCGEDPTTSVSDAKNGTVVYRTGGISRIGGTWIEIGVFGRPYWVAASKLSCN